MIPNKTKETCKNCGGPFEKRIRKRQGHIPRAKLRAINSVNCSPKCSREWIVKLNKRKRSENDRRN